MKRQSAFQPLTPKSLNVLLLPHAGTNRMGGKWRKLRRRCWGGCVGAQVPAGGGSQLSGEDCQPPWGRRCKLPGCSGGQPSGVWAMAQEPLSTKLRQASINFRMGLSVACTPSDSISLIDHIGHMLCCS